MLISFHLGHFPSGFEQNRMLWVCEQDIATAYWADHNGFAEKKNVQGMPFLVIAIQLNATHKIRSDVSMRAGAALLYQESSLRMTWW